MQPKTTFGKRKKFTEKPTPTSRLLDRWDQQVFFILQKNPSAAPAISRIRESHVAKFGQPFIPSEDALLELAELQFTD